MKVQNCTENDVPEGNPWIEEYSYSLEELVLGFARDMVENFNNTRREGESKRILKDIELH